MGHYSVNWYDYSHYYIPDATKELARLKPNAQLIMLLRTITDFIWNLGQTHATDDTQDLTYSRSIYGGEKKIEKLEKVV